MATGTPVIGKVPNLKPSWLTEENGVWTYQFNEIVDIIANFTQNWLEDNISEELYINMENTANKFTDKSIFDNSVISKFEEYLTKRMDSFSTQLEKINVTEEENN